MGRSARPPSDWPWPRGDHCVGRRLRLPDYRRSQQSAGSSAGRCAHLLAAHLVGGVVRADLPCWRMGDALVAGRPPDVALGRNWPASEASRPQLREDGNAHVFSDRGGILRRTRRWFVATGTPVFRLLEEEWSAMADAQKREPQLVGRYRERTYWWYADSFFWTNGNYGAPEVKALLFARERRAQRELEHAHAVLGAASAAEPIRQREAIPREVKLAVWKRDGGRCVECGSDFDLQYDHVIPFSMNGASTVQNLQLLCAPCNQSKGGRL